MRREFSRDFDALSVFCTSMTLIRKFGANGRETESRVTIRYGDFKLKISQTTWLGICAGGGDVGQSLTERMFVKIRLDDTLFVRG